MGKHIFTILGLCAVLVSVQSCAPDRAQEPAENSSGCCATETAEEGIAAAKRDAMRGDYGIIRYDLPRVMTGGWMETLAPFSELDIRLAPRGETLEYCRAYNREMDRMLIRHHGDKYRKLRSKILPPTGAGMIDAILLKKRTPDNSQKTRETRRPLTDDVKAMRL